MGAAEPQVRLIDYYPPGPVAREFIRSQAFICGLMGPIGSGKSTAAIMKLLRNAQDQPMTKAGLRRSRYAIIRNTAPELKTTTMKSWHEWIPKDQGRWVGQGPPTHHITQDGIDMEVMFVALDSPDDVKKLLSMELTGAWINEAREIPKAILDGLTGRVGRFKPDVMDETLYAYCPQILMDTNPPEDDHWWSVLSEGDVSTPFGRQMLRSMTDAENELRAAGLLAPGQPLFQFFKQPGAYEPGAENLHNLIPGYYARAKAGKTQQWIDVYINGKYGYVQDGTPVFPDYNDAIHSRADLEPIPGIKIQVGLDFGLSPAAIFGQRSDQGQWRIYSEIVGEGMNLYQFAAEIKAHAAEHYISRGFKIGKITGDPAGDNRDPNDKQTRTTFQILASEKVHAVPSPDPSNSITRRLAAVQMPLTRLVAGEPALVIHRRCKVLRKGMSGGYNYKRVKVSGDERYQSIPDKNRYSHPCDATQYLLLGGGEYERILDAGSEPIRPDIVEDYYTMDGVM